MYLVQILATFGFYNHQPTSNFFKLNLQICKLCQPSIIKKNCVCIYNPVFCTSHVFCNLANRTGFKISHRRLLEWYDWFIEVLSKQILLPRKSNGSSTDNPFCAEILLKNWSSVTLWYHKISIFLKTTSTFLMILSSTKMF